MQQSTITTPINAGTGSCIRINKATSVDKTMKLMGAMGVSNEHPISKMVAAARSHRYAMGVSEMQLETIMRAL